MVTNSRRNDSFRHLKIKHDTGPYYILVQVTIGRRLGIGRDGHLDQSEAYDILQRVREYCSAKPKLQ